MPSGMAWRSRRSDTIKGTAVRACPAHYSHDARSHTCHNGRWGSGSTLYLALSAAPGSQREPSDTDAPFLHRHHGPLLQIICALPQNRHNQCDDRLGAQAFNPDTDNGGSRCTGMSKEGMKISIKRDYDSIFGDSKLEDGGVIGSGIANFANVNRVDSERAQERRSGPWQPLIKQQLH